jgi:hypothetical protein
VAKKFLALGIVFAVVLVGMFGIYNQYSYADDKKTVREYVKLTGEYIKNNPELLSKSLDVLDSKSFNESEVVTTVDLLPITIGEIEFRKGLRDTFGSDKADDKSIFNTLVEEKIILSYAIRNNVLPSKSEIDEFINSEKSTYEQDADCKELVDNFCSAANMTIDEYWKTYEYYNAFRLVALKNSFNKAVEIGVNKGLIKDFEENNKQLDSQIYKEHTDYWDNIKKELKGNITIKSKENYNNRNFTLDVSKLYL